MNSHRLQNLFYPESIALIGASNTPEKLGNYVAKNLIQSNYQGSLYFLNPKKESICGLESTQKPIEIKEHIDLWVIAIPAALVIPAVLEIVAQMQEIKSQKSTFITIISAGFKEIGIAGQVLETELLGLSKKHNFSIVGPNCLGLINNQQNTKFKFNASFAVNPKIAGNVSFISQSGAIISGIINREDDKGIGFNKIISCGNQADLEVADFLEFLIQDPETKVIAIYVEGFQNGAKFIEIAKKSPKPIVVLKSGDYSSSQKAVSSHTGSIAGNSQVAESYVENANCILVQNLEEFFDVILLLSKWN